jgi:uncharacterized membrane protein YgcG
MERIRTVVSACVVAVSCAGAVSAQQATMRYDASVGTLPTAQGFSLFDDQWGPPAFVRDGVLEQGLTDFSTSQFHHARGDIDFTKGYVVRASMKVQSSTYHLNSCASAIRFGYYLGAIDRAGRMAYIGIGDSTLYVLTSPMEVPGPGRPVVSFPVRGSWRDFEMVIRETGIELRVDGVTLQHYPLGAPGVVPGSPSGVIFGDGTACGASKTSLRWAEFEPLPDCPADFNEDGFVDFTDYDDFVACFEGFWCPPGKDADINGDGFVDLFDYDDFVAAFEEGCGASGSGGGGGDDGDGQNGGDGSGGGDGASGSGSGGVGS